MERKAKSERGGLMWERTVPNPRIWHTFRAKNLNGSNVEYEIRDIPTDRYIEAVDFMTLFTFQHLPLFKELSK